MNAWVFFITVCVIFGTAKSLLGAWKIETNSTGLEETVQKAIAMVSKTIDSEFHMKLIEIKKVESKVVSGKIYRLEMLIGPSTCKKSENYSITEIQNCSLQDFKEPYHCHVLLWVQPWVEEKYKLTSSNCTQVKSFKSY